MQSTKSGRSLTLVMVLPNTQTWTLDHGSVQKCLGLHQVWNQTFPSLTKLSFWPESLNAQWKSIIRMTIPTRRVLSMILQMVVVHHLIYPTTFFFPLEVSTLTYLQTDSITTLTMTTTMIGIEFDPNCRLDCSAGGISFGLPFSHFCNAFCLT